MARRPPRAGGSRDRSRYAPERRFDNLCVLADRLDEQLLDPRRVDGPHPSQHVDALVGYHRERAAAVIRHRLPHYRHSHLPGANNLPHDEVDALAPELLPDKDAEIVVYCANGPCPDSGIATSRLVELGYTNVADYHEGKDEWVAAGLPVEGRARAAV